MNKMNNAPQIVGRVTLSAAKETLLPGQQMGKQSDQGDRSANLSWDISFVKRRTSSRRKEKFGG